MTSADHFFDYVRLSPRRFVGTCRACGFQTDPDNYDGLWRQTIEHRDAAAEQLGVGR